MSFAEKLIRWQRRHGRRGLPWQGTRDPYRIWLSEVMLQQTQVATVVPYFERFIRKYPGVEALAAASEDEVLQLWSGLGYYARGRNLHLASQKIAFEHEGEFPDTAEKLAELPGVGRSTAAAVAVFAFGERAAILDGNAKRVLARCFGVEKELWPLAERLLPKRGIARYTQALMDLGATLCSRKKPDCAACPVARQCVARKQGRVHELPAPRARKALPLRHISWYVYRHAETVLLERRPSPGIWGGLWCFPEKAVVAARTTKKLASIDHGFTHFRLRIQPFLLEVRSPSGRPIKIKNSLWIDLGDARRAAVPAPVRKLLEELRSTAAGASGRRRARAAPA